jgi:DNA polymerase elongation subunit (family B)
VRFIYDKVPPGRLSVYNEKVDRSSVTEFIFLENEGFYRRVMFIAYKRVAAVFPVLTNNEQ